MQKSPKLRFPKKFLWGAATSAHQVEGNTHNQWTVWELENANSLAAQASHQWDDLDNWDEIKALATHADNYVSGNGIDHYNRFEKDFDIVQKLHMNSFRFSVEWSRVQPEEGAWNVEAVEHYKKYVQELKKRDIEPIVTLFHFTLPIWFSEKGGFTQRKNVKHFVSFAERMTRELGPSVKYIITLNEPEVYAQESYLMGHWPPMQTSKKTFWRVMSNLAYAHNKSSDVIHKINRRYKVSIAKNSAFVYAGDDALLSRTSAMIMQYLQDDYFLKKVVKTCDFIGVNYYFSNRVYGSRMHNPDIDVSDLGWDMNPANIQHALERVYEKYKLPIMITENGLADANDTQRQWWITQTLVGMQKAMGNGVELWGYLHWSLLDNFEWDKGRWPRFGLIAVDDSSLKRTARPSAVWFSKILKHLREDAQ
jgi:beta-glucosidase